MAAKKKPAIQRHQGHNIIGDIVHGASNAAKDIAYDTKRVGKGIVKGANWISQPKNQNKVGRGIYEQLLSGKEVNKIAKGKGTKKDYASVAGNAAAWFFPYGKAAKGINMIKGGAEAGLATRAVAKSVRGVAKGAMYLGIDEAAKKGVMTGANAVKPVRRIAATGKPKTKPKGK